MAFASPFRSMRSFASFLPLALALAAVAPAQTVIPVNAPTSAAVEAAVVAANALAFQTSAAQPVVIEFASNLIGQTIFLTTSLPILSVDWLTMRVAGAGPTSRVILDGTSSTTTLRVNGRHATFRNLHFQNAGPLAAGNDVFTASGADDLRFVDCGFQGAGGNGLWLLGVLGVSAENCLFQNNPTGLAAASGTSGVTVSGCTFLNNKQGILLAVTHDTAISGSTFDGNGIAVAIQPVCTNTTFGPNNVVRNTTTQPSIIASGALFLSIIGNQFVDNRHAAIQIVDLAAFVSVTGNVLLRNGNFFGTYQLSIGSSQDVTIGGLQCNDGGGGIYASASQRVSIVGTSAQPTAIVNNRIEGIFTTGCSDLAVNGVVLDHNLQGAAGAQLTVISGARVDVVGSSANNATGGGRFGVRIDASSDVRVGEGTAVLDNSSGIFVSNSSDVVLGNWTGQGGSLQVRGQAPLHMVDSPSAWVGSGSSSASCSVRGGPVSEQLVLSVTRCDGSRFGPNLVVDGVGAGATALQIADSDDVVVENATFVGHTFSGVVGTVSQRLLVRDCTIDGGTLNPQASGFGFLANPGCHHVALFRNLVRRQQGGGFAVVDSDDAVLGPGNRAFDNGGDGFLVQDGGSGTATRRALLQSVVAVGRNLSGQSGVRSVHAVPTLVNCTMTRNGTGVLLQVGTNATLVNTISHGNTADRNRDPQSAGTWLQCIRGNSSGGTWNEQSTIVGNPMFVSPSTNDVRLLAGSPAIDSGLHATPVGARLPSADAANDLRIRNATIDRGAHEFVLPGNTGNTLDVAGSWIRGYADGQLAFTVRATPVQAGQLFLLLASGSGTGPTVLAPGGVPVPIVPDAFTGVLLGAPAVSTGVLNASGLGATTLAVPEWAAPLLPELTFVAVATTWPVPSNPVVVRFVP